MQAPHHVTKEIVRDLLPVYLAGEASADTRAAVEAFLAEDVELREIVESAGKHSLPPLEPPPNLEVRSLQRTRRLLGRKNFWLGFALIFSSVSPFLQPWWLADLVLLIGLGGWAPFLLACRDLSATGLEAPRGWAPRRMWALVGFWIGGVIVQIVEQQTGWHRGTFLVAAVTAGVALWIGEKLHQIPTDDQVHRPQTLFGK